MQANGVLPYLTLGVLISLAGCAGTPPASDNKVASKKCEHVTGSLLCGSDDDQPSGSLNAPSDTLPTANLSRSAAGGGGH
jgi:hypothetical protein